jgi:hypothetical protein
MTALTVRTKTRGHLSVAHHAHAWTVLTWSHPAIFKAHVSRTPIMASIVNVMRETSSNDANDQAYEASEHECTDACSTLAHPDCYCVVFHNFLLGVSCMRVIGSRKILAVKVRHFLIAFNWFVILIRHSLRAFRL